VTKRNDTWMPLYIGDYLADTSRLSTEQHGAYLLMLMDYWRNGPPLDDDEELASITKLPVAVWRKHSAKLRTFFEAVDGRLFQKRADAERQKAGVISSKRSEAGKAGAAKKWGKQADKKMASAMANAMANGQQNDGPSPSPSQRLSEVGNTSSHDAPGSQLPTDTPGDAGTSPGPTLAGRACLALRGANVHDVNPSHPDLLRLLAAGVRPEDIGATAAELVAAGKPARMAYVLRTVESRMQQAAQRPAVEAAPPPDPMAWANTRAGVEEMGCRLGIGPFVELDHSTGRAIPFTAYRRRVIASWEATQPKQEAAA